MGSRDSFLVASASIRTDVFSAMPNKPVAKKPIPDKPQAIKPTQKNVAQKKPAPDKLKDLRLLKETLKTSPVQKKSAPDKVENLAIEYLAELKEVDVTFEKGTVVLEKYRAKYPELASYIREIVPGERRISEPASACVALGAGGGRSTPAVRSSRLYARSEMLLYCRRWQVP